jgi:hypothetical protein
LAVLETGRNELVFFRKLQEGPLNPRLQNSLKFQEFPIDSIRMIKEVVAKNFKAFVKEKKIIVQGLIYTEEILLRVGFQEKGIAQQNFEASIGYSAKDKNIMEQIYAAFDAVGSMIDQYVKAGGDIELPIDWTEFKFDEKLVYLQTSKENSDLEAAANKFLSDA